jgi:ATP-dependent helicase/nuclease subunit A
MLELLSPIAPEHRAAHAHALLSLDEDAATIGDPTPLIDDALNILADPAFAAIFASDTLAEVDITAIVHGQRLIGTIDRLIVTPTTVTAIDFKTNRLTPTAPDQTPEGLLRQMGAYAAMLAQVWPGRTIETAILWTARPLLMPLPPPLVMAALQRAPFP